MPFNENYCKSYYSQCRINCARENYEQQLEYLQEISKYRSLLTAVSSLTSTLTTLVKNSTISSPSTTTSVINSITYNSTTTLPNTTMETIKNMFTAVKGSYDNTVDAVPKTINTMNTTLILVIILVIIACATFIIVYCICQRMTTCTSCCIGCNNTWHNRSKKICRKPVRTLDKQLPLREYDEIKMVYENEYLRPNQPAS